MVTLPKMLRKYSYPTITFVILTTRSLALSLEHPRRTLGDVLTRPRRGQSLFRRSSRMSRFFTSGPPTNAFGSFVTF